MSSLDTIQELVSNSTNKAKLTSNFYVTFLGLPVNISNILGGSVKNITRPDLDLETVETNHRSNKYKDMMKINMSPVTIAFHDDEDSIVSSFINVQLFTQLNRAKDAYGRMGIERDYKFDIKLETYKLDGSISEGFILRDCFIQNINNSDHSYASTTEKSEISITLEYENIDILMFGEWWGLLSDDRGE